MKNWLVLVSIVALFHLTQGQLCTPLQCDNGRCVSTGLICDGIDQCGDNSDEGGESGICPECPSNYFKCTNGRCIYDYWVRDGYTSCSDGSDETEYACPCSKDEKRCDSPPGMNYPAKCVPSEWICDEEGIWDCPLGDDERSCDQRVSGRNGRNLL